MEGVKVINRHAFQWVDASDRDVLVSVSGCPHCGLIVWGWGGYMPPCRDRFEP